jgi:hypothetical protein
MGIINTQSTGLEILLQVMTNLKAESEQVSSKHGAKESMLAATSVKILHLNIMLAACVTLDFITVPILQGQLKRTSPEDSTSVEMDAGGLVSTDAGGQASIDAEDILSLDDNPSCQKFASFFKTFIPKFGPNSSLAWSLINTLLDILTPLKNAPDWVMADQTFKRLARQHFGILLSRKILANVHEDVDDLVASTTSSPTKTNLSRSKSSLSPVLLKNKPVVNAAEGNALFLSFFSDVGNEYLNELGVSWVMFRCLESFVENGIELLGRTIPSEQKHLAVLAMRRSVGIMT